MVNKNDLDWTTVQIVEYQHKNLDDYHLYYWCCSAKRNVCCRRTIFKALVSDFWNSEKYITFERNFHEIKRIKNHSLFWSSKIWPTSWQLLGNFWPTVITHLIGVVPHSSFKKIWEFFWFCGLLTISELYLKPIDNIRGNFDLEEMKEELMLAF